LFSFSPLDLDPSSCFHNREVRSQLLQYNLSDNLQLFKFRFTGHMSKSTSDYDQLLREFFSSPLVVKTINCTGSVELPVHYDAAPLKLTITNMRFFDKILDNTGERGRTVSVRLLTISLMIFNPMHRSCHSRG